ncbi:MAG: hypothetical protein JO048_15645 [Methylobacteriaceae bacterium]|nr:hypothetical protein [Methylobacteriaceae bacterium]
MIAIAAGLSMTARAASVAGAPQPDARAFASRVGGKTYLSFSPQHGTQVEYLSSDGRAYLWYPGNQQVLAGQWRAEPDPFAPKFLESPIGSGNIYEAPPRFRLCYRYGPATYNPVTGSSGDKWECQGLFQGLGEARPGDFFGLVRARAAPLVLSKQRYSFEELRALVRRR